ncbi:MAG: DUF6528 family protein [Phycisphaeraceae bacterium]
MHKSSRWISFLITATIFLFVLLLPQRQPRDAGAQPSVKSKNVTLVLSGGDEIFEVDLPRDGDLGKGASSPGKTWEWQARASKDIPKQLHNAFIMISECKPVDHGRRLLITAKEGGTALVNRESRKTEFVTLITTGTPYSGELLPENRLVFAVGGKSGRLVGYDLDGVGQPLFNVEFESAHGVHWDAESKTLWAVGFSDIRSYELTDWKTPKPSLKLIANFALPKKDGHDLAPVPGTKELIVSTGEGVYLFDTEKKRFKGHPLLGTYAHVKSVSVHPETEKWAYVMPDGENWWTSRVRFVGDRNGLIFSNAKLYKARWLVRE